MGRIQHDLGTLTADQETCQELNQQVSSTQTYLRRGCAVWIGDMNLHDCTHSLPERELPIEQDV